jgi:hypothetical protein
VQRKRILFVFANVVASLMWLRFLVRLIEQWNLMKPDIRDAASIFMAFFCLLWLNIVRDKGENLSLLAAFGILATVYRIVWILMKNPVS